MPSIGEFKWPGGPAPFTVLVAAIVAALALAASGVAGFLLPGFLERGAYSGPPETPLLVVEEPQDRIALGEDRIQELDGEISAPRPGPVPFDPLAERMDRIEATLREIQASLDRLEGDVAHRVPALGEGASGDRSGIR